MALILNVIRGKVSFFAAAREVKRENDGGEDNGDGEKIALNAFTGFSPPPPSLDIARCGRKGDTHSRPLSRAALAWLLTTTPNGELARGLPVTVNSYKNKTRYSIFNESWQGLCFLQLPSPKMKRRTPSESLEKGQKKLSRPEMHICVRNNKTFNSQQMLPLLFLHVVASFLDF